MKNFLTALVLIALCLAADRALAQDSRHTVLYYHFVIADAEGTLVATPLTREVARPLVAYVDVDGNALDWMYDGMILFATSLYGFDGPDPDTYADHPTETEIANYHAALFDDGQLATLADTVAELRAELDDPDYRLTIYLTVPRLCTASDPAASSVAHTESLLVQYRALGRPELELAGFYFGFKESYGPNPDATPPLEMPAVGSFLDGEGLSQVWIPYFYQASPAGSWPGWGLDRLALQPNYAFDNSNPGLERFFDADVKMRGFGMSGIEIELGGVRNASIPGANAAEKEHNSALAYLQSADRFNWTRNLWNVTYRGAVVAGYASSVNNRSIYDGLYRVIAANPRHSVAERSNLPAESDTYVEELEGRRDVTHGDSPRLDVGTNLTGNATRTFVRFDLSVEPSDRPPLAAHLHLQMVDFAYGSMINDAELFTCTGSWDEVFFAAEDEPSLACTKVADHRFTERGSAWHSFEVTDEVAAAVAGSLDSVTFMVRRHDEDGTEALAVFFSREESVEAGPSLSIVYPPTTEPPDTVDAGPEPNYPDAGPDTGPRDDASPLAGADAGSGCHCSGTSPASSSAALLLLLLLVIRIRSVKYR